MKWEFSLYLGLFLNTKWLWDTQDVFVCWWMGIGLTMQLEVPPLLVLLNAEVISIQARCWLSWMKIFMSLFQPVIGTVFQTGQVIYLHNLQIVVVMTRTKQSVYKTLLCCYASLSPLIFESSVAECKHPVSKSYHVVTEFPNGLRSCFLTCKITSLLQVDSLDITFEELPLLNSLHACFRGSIKEQVLHWLWHK